MDIVKQSHHSQQDLCSTRPCYRQGKKLTAVKVYTVSDESRHLLISQVPAIKLQAELCALCNRFGDITTCSLVPHYENDNKFVETYHVQYSRIQSSRFAKKQLDGRSFFGGVLHVCYAPELETVSETREKLVQRRKEVATRIKKKGNSAEKSQAKRHGNFSRNINTNIIPVGTISELNNSYNCNRNITSQTNYPSESDMEATTSTGPQISEPQHTFSNSKPLSNTLKFIPRSVTVAKRIVFHKKKT